LLASPHCFPGKTQERGWRTRGAVVAIEVMKRWGKFPFSRATTQQKNPEIHFYIINN